MKRTPNSRFSFRSAIPLFITLIYVGAVRANPPPATPPDNIDLECANSTLVGPQKITIHLKSHPLIEDEHLHWDPNMSGTVTISGAPAPPELPGDFKQPKIDPNGDVPVEAQYFSGVDSDWTELQATGIILRQTTACAASPGLNCDELVVFFDGLVSSDAGERSIIPNEFDYEGANFECSPLKN